MARAGGPGGGGDPGNSGGGSGGGTGGNGRGGRAGGPGGGSDPGNAPDGGGRGGRAGGPGGGSDPGNAPDGGGRGGRAAAPVAAVIRVMPLMAVTRREIQARPVADLRTPKHHGGLRARSAMDRHSESSGSGGGCWQLYMLERGVRYGQGCAGTG